MKNLFLSLGMVLSAAGVFAAGELPKEYFELRGGLPNAAQVFEQTGKGRVVFLGGSITAMNGWSKLVEADLKKRFPKTTFDFINAGIGSTGSTPGAFRLERDAFRKGPVDLLFEEAAVNDSTNGRSDVEQQRAMEGLVRHARLLNPQIDIVMMHFVDPAKMTTYNQGSVPKVIQNHEAVATHYNIPSINLALEVTERINNKEFTWKDDFKNLHPSPFGHALYAKTIGRLFDAAWTGDRQPIAAHPMPEKRDAFCYDAGQLLPPGRAGNLKGFKVDPKWENRVGGGTRDGFVRVPMLIGSKPGDSFSLAFTGSAVGLFVAAGKDAGMIEYRIDEGAWRKQDLYTRWSSGLHIPWVYTLDAELAIKEKHTLEVRISSDKNAKSIGHACRIVHFTVNGK